MTLKQVWNEMPIVEMPWYHRMWVETVLGAQYVICGCAGGACVMIMLITAPIWFPFWIKFHKE